MRARSYALPSLLAALVASQPLEAWKDYLLFHAVHDFAGVLPRACGSGSDVGPRVDHACHRL